MAKKFKAGDKIVKIRTANSSDQHQDGDKGTIVHGIHTDNTSFSGCDVQWDGEIGHMGIFEDQLARDPHFQGKWVGRSVKLNAPSIPITVCPFDRGDKIELTQTDHMLAKAAATAIVIDIDIPGHPEWIDVQWNPTDTLVNRQQDGVYYWDRFALIDNQSRSLSSHTLPQNNDGRAICFDPNCKGATREYGAIAGLPPIGRVCRKCGK
jgi:hypothetical protein